MSLSEAIKQIQGKKVLFLGQTRTMSEEDIALFLEHAGAKRANDLEDEPIGMIVLGRLINPYEEAFSDAKQQEGVRVVTLAELEHYYASHIDADTLMGSLSLFANQERIINLLHNRAIDDELFCKILSLYDWEEKGAFESDENRDVAGTLVARFYPDIKNNHNIQYSPLGPFLIAAHSEHEALLSTMADMPDYEVTQRSQDAWMPRTLHEALLINPHLPLCALEKFWRQNDLRQLGFVAAHPNLDTSKQKELAQRSECWIHEGLARNPKLWKGLRNGLAQSEYGVVRQAFLRYQPLDRTTIESVLERDDGKELEAIGSNMHLNNESARYLMQTDDERLLCALALNERIGPESFEQLSAMKRPVVLRALARNKAVSPEILERLSRIRDKELYIALAENPSMPENYLRNFAKIKDRDIHKALASNPSTPIEILLSYQTDGELNQILKRNEAFGAYIKQHLGM